MSALRRLHAFILGMIEFRLDVTTGYSGEDDADGWYEAYDRGRDLAHRLTFRRWDDGPPCGEHTIEWPCPRCDYCGMSECMTPQLEWNGETGCHFDCEPDVYPTSNVRVIVEPIRVSLCSDCIVMDANGWDWDVPLPDPAPLCRLDGMVIAPEGDYCESHFSKWSCDGCGTKLAGTRWCYVARSAE